MTEPKPKIVLYEDVHFGGAFREFTSDVDDLTSAGFNNRASSIKVFGSVWVAFENGQFKGQMYLLEEGEYSHYREWLGSNDQVTSLKMLNTDSLGLTPSITLYNGVNFQEQQRTFEYAIEELGYYKFNDKASSIKVKTGAWVLFNHSRFGGRQWILEEGDYPEGHEHFGNNMVNSLRPIKEPAFTTEILDMTFDLVSGMLNSTPRALVELSQTNDTSIEQSAIWKTEQSKTTSRTSEWHWDNSTVIGGSYTFKTGVPIIAQGEISMSLENTFNVGESGSEENTKEDTWEFKLPATVPPHKRVVVLATVQEGKMDVPFKATMKRGTRVWEEQCTYYGVQCFNLDANYKESDL